MRTLFINPTMGAAGDMLTAALSELFEDQNQVVEKLNGMQVPGVHFSFEKVKRCGISATHMHVSINGEEEGDHHHHHHEGEDGHSHEHGHAHQHFSMHDIEHIVMDHLKVSESVKKATLDVYKYIAEAESKVHGEPVSMIHFHEVGMMDAIADVAAVCFLMEELNVDRVVVAPINTGFGTVKCAHGILPVPAPATAEILKDMPIYAGQIEGEMCTPTGAALLKKFATYYGRMPEMTVEKYGYGAGKKDFAQAANVVRVAIGQSDDEKTRETEIVELACNVDDMTGEEIGFASEKLFEAGARDVFVTPIYMKKNRPGNIIRVICTKETKEEMVKAIFTHTSTIGVRETICSRDILKRTTEKLETEFGPVQVKISEGYGVTRKKLEYDDLARIARDNNCSIREIKEKIVLKNYES